MGWNIKLVEGIHTYTFLLVYIPTGGNDPIYLVKEFTSPKNYAPENLKINLASLLGDLLWSFLFVKKHIQAKNKTGRVNHLFFKGLKILKPSFFHGFLGPKV